jgi:hypothetical protein
MTQTSTLTLSIIREQVECELGGGVPDSIWDYLEEIGRVEEVESGREDIHWLANEVRKVQTASGLPEKGVKAPPVLPEEEWDTEEVSPGTARLRLQALSLLLAREASKEPRVVQFRSEHLGGKVLPHAEVEGWLKQQAEQDGAPRDWLTVPVVPDPKGPISTPIEAEDLVKQFGTTHTHWGFPYKGEVASRTETRFIEYSVPQNPWRRIQPIAPGGVLEKLWKLVRYLRFVYNPWSDGQAAMFILTGLPPKIESVERHVSFNAKIEANTRITLTIDPAVTPPELAEIYAKVRSGITTGRIRSLSDKHLRLAILCAESSDKDTWDQKMQRWNDTYPEDDYPGYPYDDRRAFHRDAVQACERLLHPQYQFMG